MIPRPPRSVTRFFIPLIDVMVLLFCIFLLMPAGDPGPEVTDTAPAAGPFRGRGPQAGRPADEPALARELQALRREAERLRREKEKAVSELRVVVLEIDAASGKLFEGTGADRSEIDTEARAAAVIDRHRRRAGDREVYFLFLYPRTPSAWPTQGQVDRYQGWFAGVPHGFDNPSPARP